jgi:hypothetical protein
MSNSPKKIIPSGEKLHELAIRIKLLFRLMADKRVNFLIKLIPVGGLAYLINPIDIPTPIDDLAVLGLSVYLFMELCPQVVVAEHLKNLRNVKGIRNPVDLDQDMVVDAEFFEEVDDEDNPQTQSTDDKVE